ncbi:MAG: NAD(P)H-hydrate dehydratase [Microbacterium sp.]|uniref:ADP-dependent NAD(P)H-hydrate dehydratase n=1 Tax=Microbacterium sp. TaxID=51671 RepID=UPI002606D6C9|nr:ADP/ATP-dependent (S)-NAD(P)H-hydrate dehydratase [Microbacterium sp.]MCX6501844.1 NAD(P)H-hydrate dehydratase [Microbacterium sp.]
MSGQWTAADAAGSLHAPASDDHKYSRGVVGLRTGSEAYPGAAVLGVEAAWRTGTGMVRYLGPARAADLVLARRPETVTVDGRVQAWVVGSGTDAAARSFAETETLRRLLAGDVPVVVDAGALDLAAGATAPLVVTPHAREHDALRGTLGLGPVDPAAGEEERSRAAAESAARLGGVVLLKGALTLVAEPGGTVRRVSAGTPWLATAGTGDVLAGAVGAVVAGIAARRNPDAVALADAAASAAWLHGRAASLVAAAFGGAGGPLTALDVADALPRAVAEALAAG